MLHLLPAATFVLMLLVPCIAATLAAPADA